MLACCLPGPVDTALKPVRACATVVASRYSAWRVHPALWFPAYAGMTGAGVGCFVMLLPHPVDTALKPVRACATVVSSRYSAWRVHPAPWFPAYAGMTVVRSVRGFQWFVFAKFMMRCLKEWMVSNTAAISSIHSSGTYSSSSLSSSSSGYIVSVS